MDIYAHAHEDICVFMDVGADLLIQRVETVSERGTRQKGVHNLYGFLDFSLICSPSTTKLPYP
jgi:hypothetical protein